VLKADAEQINGKAGDSMSALGLGCAKTLGEKRRSAVFAMAAAIMP
jgi:hypothetical protein